MAEDVAGISKTTDGSQQLQPRTPSTRTTACGTPKSAASTSSRSCGLRRPSAPFVSPMLKRCNRGDSQEIFSTPKRSKHETPSLSMTPDNHTEQCNQTEGSVELLSRRQRLLKTIQQKEDSLRKLRLVQMYRNKNDLSQLQALIDKWRTVSQDAAERLLDKIKADPLPTMSQLLAKLQVSKELIQYSEEDEAFY